MTTPAWDWWRIGNWAAAAFLAVYVLLLGATGRLGDAWAYYTADLSDLYEGSRVGVVSYVYPPPLAQAIQPLRILPFEVFYGLILAAEVGALAWFVTPVGAAILIVSGQPNVTEELTNANVNLILAAAVVAGFKYPGAWASLGLVKGTAMLPGLVWFAARSEWRKLVIAVVTTGVLLTISVAMGPTAWEEWFGYIRRDFGNEPWYVTPVALRLGLAAGIAYFAAQKGLRWPLPIAVVIAMPVPAFIHWTAALASLPLLRSDLAARRDQKQTDTANAQQ